MSAYTCFICGGADCVPRNHRNEVLTDKQALGLARECFADTSMSALRDRMLARVVIMRITGEDPGLPCPHDL